MCAYTFITIDKLIFTFTYRKLSFSLSRILDVEYMLLMIGTFQERGKSGETYLKFNEHAFDHQSLSSYQKTGSHRYEQGDGMYTYM